MTINLVLMESVGTCASRLDFPRKLAKEYAYY